MKTDITLEGNRVRVRCPYSPILVDRFRTLPGRDYRSEDKSWAFPAAPDIISMLCDCLGLLPMMLPPDVRVLAHCGGEPAAPSVDMSLIEKHVFKTTPYEHQRVNLARLIANKRWLIADEQGLGKSFCIANRLACFEDVRHDRFWNNFHALILCPKSVMSVWKDQLMTHADILAEVVDGNAKQRMHALVSKRPVKICNYEALIHQFDLFNSFDWRVIVCDEIHRIKNFTALTSIAARQLTAKARYVWGLSGTPAPNGIEDWLGILEAVRPGLLPIEGKRGKPTKSEFENRYLLKSQLPTGPWVVSGYRNVQELHGYIQQVCSRVTKAEALDLPPKVFSTRTVKLAGEQARIYRDIKKDAVAKLQGLESAGTLTVRNVLTESLRLLQVVGGFVPDDEGNVHEIPDKAKMAALADALDEAGDRQVVIWCQFTEEVRFIRDWLIASYDEQAVCMMGETSTCNRIAAVELFKKGDAQFFVATAATGGTGINGLEVADTEIYYSRDWNLANYLQSQDRLHRIGQKSTVNVVKLLALSTVDQIVDEALERKQGLQEMMMGRSPSSLL